MSVSVSTPVEGTVDAAEAASGSSPAAPASLALNGRVVIVKDGGEVISNVSSAPGSVSVTVGAAERVLGPDDFVPLPLPGELVAASTGAGEHVSGRFLTADLEGMTHLRGGFLRVALLLEHTAPAAGVVRWVSTVPLAGWDARQCVRGDSAGVTVQAVTTALVGQVRDRQAEDRKRARWLSNLVQEAHDEANERDWCDEFDDFMERVGLDRRTREYELRVSVNTTVYLTREAASLQEAIDSVDDDDVWNALESDELSYDVEER